MLFDLKTGQIVKRTPNSCVHFADDLLHFWCENFMYSIPFNEKIFDEYEKTEKQCIFWIDSGDSRFMFTIDKKHFDNLKSFIASCPKAKECPDCNGFECPKFGCIYKR